MKMKELGERETVTKRDEVKERKTGERTGRKGRRGERVNERAC